MDYKITELINKLKKIKESAESDRALSDDKERKEYARGCAKTANWCVLALQKILDTRYDYLKCPMCDEEDYRTCKCGEGWTG